MSLCVYYSQGAARKPKITFTSLTNEGIRNLITPIPRAFLFVSIGSHSWTPPSLLKGRGRTFHKLSHLMGGGSNFFTRKGAEIFLVHSGSVQKTLTALFKLVQNTQKTTGTNFLEYQGKTFLNIEKVLIKKKWRATL